MNKILPCLLAVISFPCAAEAVFKVTPNITGQTRLISGQQGTYVYQVTNNTSKNLSDIGLRNLPRGVSIVTDGGLQYCTFPLTLASQANCLIKLNINSQQSNSAVLGGPEVCYSAKRPVYCSQPIKAEQIATAVLPGPISYACNANIANFDYALTQRIDSSVIDAATIQSWGPARNHLLLLPQLKDCPTTNLNNQAGILWMQKRVVAAEDFWVKQKLNYCHHHVVDFSTPLISNGTPRANIPSSQGGYCSAQTNLMPNSHYYGQAVRWNYSGQGSETLDNWINNNRMWYGIDCSDFTSFVYNFAFGIQFNSDTGFQAGQATDNSQDLLTPNGQTPFNQLQPFSDNNPNSPAGVLVCKNGETEQELPECGGFGSNGYFSVFLGADIHPTPENITNEMLNLLHPGDLLFLGFAGNSGNNPTSMVTHVITWTGKKVGLGPNDIPPAQIAPEEICPNDWQPQIGDWVIIDSHYQGPDYRVFSKCFYQNNIWGVRRIIGYMESPLALTRGRSNGVRLD